MSSFYQVMAAARCPKIKKHVGIKITPTPTLKATKEPYKPGDVLIYSCESTGFRQTIKCLDDGKWNELPHCPDPSNSTCNDLEPIPHGSWNSSGPYKVGTVVSFKCNDGDDQLYHVNDYVIKNSTITINDTAKSPIPVISSVDDLASYTRYNNTGHRIFKCLPSSKWNHPMPSCTPILPEPKSNVGLVLTSAFLILIPILIIFGIAQLFIRWKKRQQQRARWKQYFQDYKYRNSKRGITFSPQNSNATIPAIPVPVTDL